MQDNLKWVCTNLLFDGFEFVFWLNLIDKPAFDILNVRDITGLGTELKYEYLLLYLGL